MLIDERIFSVGRGLATPRIFKPFTWNKVNYGDKWI